ncbi:sulfatase [Pseudomonas syringae pv. actinidiae ICMP 18804]|uniref:Sulfatase n=2 Tax=Pseudomonas syringae TaxID=317 RepID=A0A656K2L8_PSESF|nr:sulfatase [Pseudomonas syringae pv. actinidiae ICMP 19098]EPM78913.1 sulfatase [Pseudomonas syringae pv. actinidiae ICMP 18804]EPN15369.1 sulfatase [Pseudomonas syringae pv. actinidiae ICMP 19100]EPN23796.1 sulfatase [Pseudomonas syringae pv. actinidiae ICMP 19099]EPN31477.1 sulfatase [Pseudomonas syringae pv. actinidiae ICMP 18883]EPN39993.1 sulfatase [Pseudomonas syringae pv. actinidiae ICMP 19095]EPN53961.1 sulfatase [Pseudomonas syringae pv. actinidiae ICMP 19094]EPN66340.1 sulfatase 
MLRHIGHHRRPTYNYKKLRYSPFKELTNKATSDDPLIARAIAYYQVASYGFKHKLLSWKPENVKP